MNKYLFLSIIFILPTSNYLYAYKCISGNCTNGKGVIILENGMTFSGELKNNMPNGYGELTFPTKNVYKGQFHGPAFKIVKGATYLKIPSKGLCDRYIGQLSESLEFSGKGTKFYCNGDKFVGEFERGEKHGHGILYDKNLYIKQEGKWNFGLYVGNAKKKKDEYNGKNCTEGDCVNGIGTMIYHNGNKYIGHWKNGKRDGEGAYYWVNGDKYSGQYTNDKKEGEGTYTWANGIQYFGQWKNDTKNGEGKIISPNGTNYSGQFKDGKIDGEGILILPDGSKFQGHFKNDKKDGEGIELDPSGNVRRKGIWKEDQFIGEKNETPINK